ncbi:hypothetical protein KL911_003641 [Ogataea haglerorum]|uniref:uncharacterized protein n=1 Tax=Ogataea haglerorum TaxID=1937702 RepID=UPI001C895A1D|nr:uncharacterized protein KL911_003641 [Ogataea haglerorum]KAG7752359.1 hypothetical protein KL911_003641 [Ogataea haglerorum]
MIRVGPKLVLKRFHSLVKPRQVVRIPLNIRAPLQSIQACQNKEQASLEETPGEAKGRKKAKKKAKTKTVQDDEIDQFGDRGAKPDVELTYFYQTLKDIVDQYPEDQYVVLIQVGSFYELYFQQAEKHASMLGLTLSKRVLKNYEISFAGFPDYKLEKYLQIAFGQGLKAVVCDQQTTAQNVIVRPVTRLVTPGTIIDEALRDYHRTNYLLAIQFPADPFKKDALGQKIGLCWVDVGLSQFHVLETNMNELMANITRINPSEILIANDLDIDSLITGKWFPELGELKKYYISRYSLPSVSTSLLDFANRFSENKRLVQSRLEKLSQKEAGAAKILLHYLNECLPFYKLSFDLPKRSLPNTLMHIDPRAAQDLELTETIVGGFRTGALASIIDKTCTVQGSRLLNTWLLSPSTDVEEIKKRQKYIEVFLDNRMFVQELIQLLRKTTDLGRIVRRADNKRADMGEYLELGHTIMIIDEIYKMVKDCPDKKLVNLVLPLFEKFKEYSALMSLSQSIINTINPQTLRVKIDTNRNDSEVLRKYWFLKPTASSRLAELRDKYDQLELRFQALTQQLTAKFEKYGYQGGFNLIRDPRTGDFIIDVRSSRKSFKSLVDNMDLQLRERTKSSAKFWTIEWQTLGIEMLFVEQEILREEERIISLIQETLLSLSTELRQVAPIIEFLDVCSSFYLLAWEKSLVKPTVDRSTKFEIENGRHLVVEEGLRGRVTGVENFTANSCTLDSGRGWVITGPNMGGKSTFLRQNALIAILAQIGSYVPATKAHIGIIDKVFTRVGASDNIFRHQSSFMVEMNETAIILRDSTERSLAIVDELGRGTSAVEGITIAYASLAHLVKNKNCKVLFATHFGPEIHKLMQDDKELERRTDFYQTTLTRIHDGDLPIDEKLIFDHKLIPGISSHSHAFEIAQLAGFPSDALELARNTYVKATSGLYKT